MPVTLLTSLRRVAPKPGGGLWSRLRGSQARSSPHTATIAIVAVALAYRLWAVLAEVPAGTGDEALTGIVALHVAEGREFPLYLYGQHYMGAFEAYVAAPFIAAFGSSVAALRLGMLVLYAVFFWSSYWLCRRLFTPWFAVLVTGVLAFGSDRVLRDELMANGGYPEMLALGALLAALTAELAVTERGATWYAAWGLVAGLVLWADPLILPYLASLGLMLVALRWRRLLGWAGPGLVLGSAAGIAPMLWYNAHAAPGEDTVTAVLAFDELPSDAGWWQRYHAAVLLNVPRATGMCAPECAGWQVWWAFAYQVLLVAAIGLAVVGFRASRARSAMLLALALAAIVTITLYARSPRAAQDPFWNARYLSNLLISTPAVLWPLWTLGRRLRLVALVPVLATAMAATLAVYTTARPLASADTRTLDALVSTLDRIGADRVYTDFQLCHRIVYVTHERIVCATIDHELTRGWDRYLPYRAIVDRAPRVAYVLRADEPMDHQLRAHLANAKVLATVTEVAGYRIYQPERRLNVPH
jgi:hypothetical protein